MRYSKKMRPTIIYKKSVFDNKDLEKNKQKNLLDELVNNIAAKKQLMIIKAVEDNQTEEEQESYGHLNLTTLNKNDELNYEENYKLDGKKIDEQSSLYQTNQDDSEDDFFEEISQEDSIDVNNKLQKAPIQIDNKKKFFELYKTDEEIKDNNFVGNFDSVYNTENLSINLNPSNNQYIKMYDDMMNDEENIGPEKLTELTKKIFDFIKKNPISVDIGDMIIRLGNKHLSHDPVDNKGAIECFEVALKIYSQINDNMSNLLNASKSSSNSLPKNKNKDNMNDLKSTNKMIAILNDSAILNSSSVGNTKNINPYKLRAVRIRQGETLKKIVDCNITDMDTENAHNNIDLAAKTYAYLFGDKSKEVAECVFKKAYITQLEQKWVEAIEFYNYCLTIFTNVFKYTNTDFRKISHVEIGDCYFKMALIKEKQKNFPLSMEYYKIAWEIYKRHYKGDNNDECALTIFNMGLLNEIQDFKDKALNLYEQVKEIYSKIKPDSQDYIDILIKTSNLSIHFNKYEEATADLLQALTSTLKKNKCENLGELLEMFMVDPEDEEIDVYSYNADLVEICFLLSRIYSKPEYNKFQEGFEILKIVLALMPPQSEFLDETHSVLKKLLENLNNDNYNFEWEDDIVDCITHFMLKIDLETEEKKIAFEQEYENEINNLDIKPNYEQIPIKMIPEAKDVVEPKQKVKDINEPKEIQINLKDPKEKSKVIKDLRETPKDEKEHKEIKNVEGIDQDPEDDENNKLSNIITQKNAFFIKQAEMLQILAKNCSRIRLFKSAVELYLKCIVYLENIEEDEPTNHKICDYMNQIALEYTNLLNFEAATKFFEKTVNLRIKVNGPNDLKTAGAYNNLAISYNRLGDNYKALEYWQLGMEIKKNNISESDDPRLAKDYYNFSLILQKMKEFDKAIEYMLEALYIFDKKLGKNSQYSADSCLLIGELYKNNKNYQAAKQYCSRAMTFFSEKYGLEYPNTVKSQLLYAICLSLTSKYDKAVIIFKPIIESFLNKDEINKTHLFIEGLYEYAKCLDWNNKYQESLKYFEIFLESADDDWSEERLLKVSNKISQLRLLVNYKKKK